MSKYNDVSAIVNVIGNIYNNPTLLDNESYTFAEYDFPNEFHKILFGSIYNLYKLGATKITADTIEDYLSQRPKKLAEYKANKGREYLSQVAEAAKINTFDYYYQRMKKMTLLREYQKIGMDLKWLYDVDNILDLNKKQEQEDWLDNNPIEFIADIIDDKINDIKAKCLNEIDGAYNDAYDGLDELLERFQKIPEIGLPMYGDMNNAVTRGARLGKVYLRSAATGVGKTRAMIADVCSFAVPERYDMDESKWIVTGVREPTLFISTEQTLDEIQTMLVSFIAAVDEEHILTGQYIEGEWDRIQHALKLLKASLLKIVTLPDFALEEIENIIKHGIREYKVKYVAFDYIHSSVKILSEISSKAKVTGLREDNILYLIGVKLKELAVKYQIFIETATQLNGEYRDAEILDQNCLRGAKNLGDKIDVGEIMVEVTQKDIERLGDVLGNNGFDKPDIKISVYKNRRGRYKGIYLWCKQNRGECKIIPYFATSWTYELIKIDKLKIKVKYDASAF